jgi:hypothetical protein
MVEIDGREAHRTGEGYAAISIYWAVLGLGVFAEAAVAEGEFQADVAVDEAQDFRL